MHVNILGTRGIPASHGGFETFAARLAPWLRDRGHTVSVYCQAESGSESIWSDSWDGVERIHIRTKLRGAAGTIEFDLMCARHVLRQPGVDLVLGYNTALFNLLGRIFGRRIVFNMDGIEWKRAKWGLSARSWLYVNELVAANLFSATIADHPEIAKHVSSRSFRQPVMIPYGSDSIVEATDTPVRKIGLIPDRYLISIARVEPENSLLELVQAFSSTAVESKLVVLGRFDDCNQYHRAVRAAANDHVIFPGAIYDSEILASLRFHARAYVHGHQVGGTNPSLVEALGAGNAVIAHDNPFNRWVAGDSHFFFDGVAEAREQMQRVFTQSGDVLIARQAARRRHFEEFQWSRILSAYETVLVGN